jgi:TolB-like protein/Flp pilus assembly protein TadD
MNPMQSGSGGEGVGDSRSPVDGELTPSSIRVELQRILSGKTFAQAAKLQRFLRFVVEQSIDGKGGQLKEAIIALEVFEKDSSFDSRIDPVVRTEARRLRFKLAEYYGAEGRNDPIKIELPKGTYCPVFALIDAPEPVEPLPKAPSPRVRRWKPAIFAAAALLSLGLAAAALWFLSPRPSRSPAIAVLPFENLSASAEEEYFADGMTEALITTLAQVNAIRVISRTSVMPLKHTKASMPEIGRQLSVDYVVAGTVLRSGRRIRVTAQLLDPQHDRHIWAETYEREAGDVLALQDELAQAIAGQIDVRLSAQDRRRLRVRKPVAAEAQDAYMRGRYLWAQREPAGLRKSLDYFNQAIAKQPDYAAAYSALADSWIVLEGGRWMSQLESIPNARLAAARALELDPALGEPHATLGAIAAADWDWKKAENEFRQCIQLEPNYPTAHQWYAELLANWGRPDEAIREAKKAVELDPLSPIANAIVGVVHYRARRYEQAVRSFLQTRELFPHEVTVDTPLGMTYLAQGKFGDAIRVFEEELAQAGRIAPVIGLLAFARGSLGDRDGAIRLIAELQNDPRTTPALLTTAYLGVGDLPEAMDWLEKAYAQHAPFLDELKSPIFDGARSEPRFQAVLRKMNWPE